jgi:ABC-type uncharacterized transport system permease subunit
MGEGWKEIGIKDKMQIINGTACVFGAIILYFLGFLVLFVGNFQFVSGCTTLLATGLAFFGITSYVKNQMVDFEVKMNRQMKRLEESEKKRK